MRHTSMPSKTKNSSYFLLASHRPPRRVRLDSLHHIRRDHPTDSVRRVGTRAVLTEVHRRPRTCSTRHSPDPLPPGTHAERFPALGDLFRRAPWPLTQSTSGSGRQLEGKGIVPLCRRLRSVPKDGIISVVMQVICLSDYFRTIDLSVRCRALLGLAHNVPKPEPKSEPEAGGSGPAAAVLAVSCEKWGPENTRILEHGSLTWGSLVGERRATVNLLLPTRITMRDYNPSRVRQALALAGGEVGR